MGRIFAPSAIAVFLLLAFHPLAAGPIDIRAERMIEWVADEYLPPYPNFPDAEKYYFPRALARMALYGDGDPRSNFGDPEGQGLRPPERDGILDFKGRIDGGEALPGFVGKEPFHFIFLGMSRLLFAHPDAPAMVANRDAYLEAGMNRRDNFNAFTSEGTENHINMSRTAGYIYAVEAAMEPEKYPDAADLAARMRGWLLDWSRLLYAVGDGEWNSTIYIAYNMAGWFNVFDYTAPGARGADAEVHAAARAVLDYYAAQLALHYSWGLLGGAEMRGKDRAVDYTVLSGATDYINWLWFSDSTMDPPGGFQEAGFAAVYAALSGYRPPRAVVEFARTKFEHPGMYHVASPGYLMSRPGETLRSLWVGRHFTLGSAAQPVGGWVSSSWQIVNWKLLAEDPKGGLPRLVWGNGGYRGTESGSVRNPWDQFAQAGPVFVQMSRVPKNAEAVVKEIHGIIREWRQNWETDFSKRWPVADRGGFKDGAGTIHYLGGSLRSALLSRIFFPDTIRPAMEGGVAFLDLRPVYVALRSIRRSLPLQRDAGVLEDFGERDELSGFVVEVGDAGDFTSFKAFKSAVLTRTALDKSGLDDGRIVYTNLAGERVTFTYGMAGGFQEPEYDMAYGVTEPITNIQGADWKMPVWPQGEGYGRIVSVAVNGEVLKPGTERPFAHGPLMHHEQSILRVTGETEIDVIDYSGARPEFFRNVIKD